jgi:cell wall-associated NlpC family hydrolase
VKEEIERDVPTAVPSGPRRTETEYIYYEAWEQEYPEASGPPFPSPTPYVLVGTTYRFGQRVRVPPLFVLADAQGGPVIGDGRQIYRVTVTWFNPTSQAVAVDHATQVTLRAITTAEGREVTNTWRTSVEAIEQSGISSLSRTIPPGESTVVVPILAPAGEPKTVDVTVQRSTSYAPEYASTGTPAAMPTTTPETSPTANTNLQAPTLDTVVVQFVNAGATDPPCDNPGAVTDYAVEGYTLNGGVADGPIAAPAGANRVVELALQQVGKPYVWGATGPNAFDCTGLMVWVYAQIGVRIPYRVSYEQYANLKPVDAAQLQPGDLVYFAAPGGRVSHAAMAIGDIDNDGTWDIVHAMSPAYGIRVTPDVFNSAYYAGPSCQLCIVGFRTMR